jgi:protein pelota
VSRENQHVKLGAYHTIDLELHHPFTLAKNEWDAYAKQRVDEACDTTRQASIAAIVMEEGKVLYCYEY